MIVIAVALGMEVSSIWAECAVLQPPSCQQTDGKGDSVPSANAVPATFWRK
jgi:hypothetical protein